MSDNDPSVTDLDAPAADLDAAAEPDKPAADPEELDFTDDESVVEIGEGRYVVGTNGRPNVERSRGERRAPPPDDERRPEFAAADSAGERRPPGGTRGGRESAPTAGRRGPGGAPVESAPAGGAPDVDRRAVSRWLAASFDGDGFDYGIDATLHAHGDTARQRTASDDVAGTFDTLLSWFASNAGPDSPPPEAIGLLLAAAETPVDLPPVVIKRFAAERGLSASDSIGDLVRAAEEEGGFRIE